MSLTHRPRRALRRGDRLASLLLALGLVACGDISNEDLRFLAVLPDARLRAEVPVEEGQALDSVGRLRPLEHGGRVAGELNEFARQAVEGLQRVVAGHAPSERAPGRRAWGPFSLRGGTARGRLVMEREPGSDAELPRYSWQLEVAPIRGGRAGEFEALVTGTARGEDFDHSEGSLRLDLDVLHRHGGLVRDRDPRSVELRWSRDGARWSMEAEVEPRSQRPGHLVEGMRYRYAREEDGSGEFRLARRAPVLQRRFTGDEEERVEALLKWNAARAGRAEWRISEGEAPKPIRGSSCWNERGQLAFHRDDGDLAPELGTEAECVFPAQALP